MKIKNFMIASFAEHLFSLNYKHDTYGHRMRNKMIKILEKKNIEFHEEVKEVRSRYALKDGEGNPIIENDTYMFNTEDQEKVKKEIEDIMNEDAVIEQNETNKDVLLSIKKSVQNIIPFDLEGEKAQWYDFLCDIVEQIKYEET